MTDFQKIELAKLLKIKECSEFIHGDCIGSDAQANSIALNAGIKIFTIHPPDNPNKRAWCFDDSKETKSNRILTPYEDVKGIRVRWHPAIGYLERNKNIVDQSDLLIATPKEFRHSLRSGTWATIRHAWKTKKNLVIIPPVERPQEEFTESKEGYESSKGITS